MLLYQSNLVLSSGLCNSFKMRIAAALLTLYFYRKFNYNQYSVIFTVILYCVIDIAAYVIFRYRVPAMPFMYQDGIKIEVTIKNGA